MLLGSDAAGLYQLAVILSSGTILFYDLATYCVPGAAWHPDCCAVGVGHKGRVSTTLEVTFKCPPQHLLGCSGSQEAAAMAGHSTSQHGSLPRPVSWQFSGSVTKATGHSHSTRSSADGDGSGSGHAAAGGPACEQGGVPPVLGQGWCSRPAQGGVVPLLLTGGRDGSVRAWDLRLQHLGQAWMAVYPHTGKKKRGEKLWGSLF